MNNKIKKIVKKYKNDFELKFNFKLKKRYLIKILQNNSIKKINEYT